MTKIFDFKSKTFWGVLLGVLGILLGSADYFEGLPALAAQIIQVVGLIVAAMGVRDAMLEQQTALIKKIIDAKSKTFWGVLIVGIVYVVDNSETLPIPDELNIPLKIIGALVSFMGLRDAAKRGRLGTGK